MAHYDSYIICTSPRSGSTLLCKLLAATGVAGNPESWFHTPSVSDWLNYFDLPADQSSSERTILATVFNAAIAQGSCNTGMFGLRLQRHSFDFFAQKLATLQPGQSCDRERLAKAFGHTAFIHLSRPDKIEQAVSYVIAEQTGLWHRASDGSELERLSAPRAAVYDAHRIAACVEQLTGFDRAWQNWFTAENIDPLRICYDALSADPTNSLCSVLGHLGLDTKTAANVVPAVSKLADDINQQWVERFCSEYSAL